MNFADYIPAFITEHWYLTLGATSICFMYWIGLLKPMNPEEKKFEGATFFYKDFQDTMDKLNGEFDQIYKDVAEYVNTLPMKVAYPVGGIYYDDP